MTGPADLILRTVVPDDAPVLARLQMRARAEAYRYVAPQAVLRETSAEERTQAWRMAVRRQEGTSDEGVVVVERDGQVIGFGAYGPQRRSTLAEQGFGHEIGSLVVARSAQGAGVGRKVLRRIFAKIDEAGGHAASIRVTRSNDRGRDFVEGAGAEILDDGLGNASHVLEEVTYGWTALRIMRRPVDLRGLQRPRDPDLVKAETTPRSDEPDAR